MQTTDSWRFFLPGYRCVEGLGGGGGVPQKLNLLMQRKTHCPKNLQKFLDVSEFSLRIYPLSAFHSLVQGFNFPNLA